MVVHFILAVLVPERKNSLRRLPLLPGYDYKFVVIPYRGHHPLPQWMLIFFVILVKQELLT
jgi:hypothetical protein